MFLIFTLLYGCNNYNLYAALLGAVGFLTIICSVPHYRPAQPYVPSQQTATRTRILFFNTNFLEEKA
jgi:hypothetical protein